jgi:hypothetical protein
MNGFAPFAYAIDRTMEEARSALPDSPIRPDPPKRTLRLRTSVAIHRLADRIDPSRVTAPTRHGTPGMAGAGR